MDPQRHTDARANPVVVVWRRAHGFDEASALVAEQLADTTLPERFRRALEGTQLAMAGMKRFRAAMEAGQSRRDAAVAVLTELADDPSAAARVLQDLGIRTGL